jgi:deoxyribonuclease V
MIACVDVDYRDDAAQAACVLLRDWTDADSAGVYVEPIASVAPYQPGQFYRRELPCLLAVLAKVKEPLDAVIVDGYVWLRDGMPGLGAHLYEALGRTVPVVGVAKTRFASAATEAVVRGTSRRPLFVTAAGMDSTEAADCVRRMHGLFRIPTVLRKVDQLCRATRAAAGLPGQARWSVMKTAGQGPAVSSQEGGAP